MIQSTAAINPIRQALGAGMGRLPPASLPLTRSVRIDLLRGMLARLEDVTPAGQHYLIAKVLPQLRREALDPRKHFRPRDREIIIQSLAELEHEAAKVAPDAFVFSQKAQVLVDVFALA